MGVQCTILVSYYEVDPEKTIWPRIADYLHRDVSELAESDNRWTDLIIGNRGTEVDFMLICMKDWDVVMCQAFFQFLTELEWSHRESVQLYWQPSHYRDWEPFHLTSLF